MLRAAARSADCKADLAVATAAIHSGRMKERLLQLLRFCAVGGSCLVVGLGVLAGLHELAGINYLVAYVASFVVSNISGYLLNARFTFSVKVVTRAGALRYMAVNGALLCTNTLAMKLSVDALHLWYLTAAIIVACLATPLSFFAQRVITYRMHVGDRLASV